MSMTRMAEAPLDQRPLPDRSGRRPAVAGDGDGVEPDERDEVLAPNPHATTAVRRRVTPPADAGSDARGAASDDSARRVLEEKAFAAERQLAVVRLLVIAVGIVTVVPVLSRPGTVPWLAYALLACSVVYGVYVLKFEPYRRHPVLLSSCFTATTDAAFTMVWLYATGGFASPYHVALCLAIVSVAFRFPPVQTALAAVLYAGSYVALLGGLDQLEENLPDVVVRVAYVALAAVLGIVVSREMAEQTSTAVRLRERMEAEEQRLSELHAARDELERRVHERTHELTTVLHRLEEAVATRDEFVSVASHELRTPLTALVLQLGHLRRRLASDAPEEAARLDRALRQTDRLTRLIDGLLDGSRLASGRLVLHREPMDLGEVAGEAVAAFRDEAARAGCTIELRLAGPARGSWDPLRIEQLVASLLSNAVKYGAGLPIEVAVSSEGGVATLSVRDHGIGIAPEDAARIFQRFERAVSIRHYGGLGLGLYFARRIADAHGGVLRVASRKGEGATFTLELPHDPIPTAT